MKQLSEEIVNFFLNQGCIIVSTIDKSGFAHSSCKGLVYINRRGKAYLLDLYQGNTCKNLERNPHISITAVDEHKFSGYCLKGKGKVLPEGKIRSRVINAWEERIAGRLSRRLIKNLHEEKGHPMHPEILLPHPRYLIVMEVEEIVDLTPAHIKSGGK